MSKTKNTVTSCNNVNWKNLVITELNDNDRIPSQQLAYARYDDNQLYIQTPEMILDNYGIPDGDGPFYQTVKQQAHLKLPLNINENVENEDVSDRENRQKKLELFKNKLSELDTIMESDKMKEQLFGKKNMKKYTYTKIVRKALVPVEDSDSEDDEEKEEIVKIVKPDFMKCKIPLSYPDEDVVVDVYRKNKTDSEEFETDGKYTKMELKSLAELKSHIVYMRKHKFVLHFSKIWASKQPLAGQTLKNYGVTFKLVRVEIQGRPMMKQLETDDKNPFIDSDEEEDENEEDTNVKHFVENDKESEEESDEDSDKKPVIKSKKRTVKKTA